MTEHQTADKFVENGTMTDIPGISQEKQTIIDEKPINETFEPANNALDGLREAGDWLIQSITDIFNQLFGNLM